MRSNSDNPSSGRFPAIVGFAEPRSEEPRAQEDGTLVQDYLWGGEVLYRLIRPPSLKLWEMEEHRHGKAMQWSRGQTLTQALQHALFSPSGQPLPGFKSILLAVDRERENEAVQLMYFLGGYVGYWFSEPPEQAIIRAHYVDPQLWFLPYHRVPEVYIPWLARELLAAGILDADRDRKLWVYDPKSDP